MFTCLSCQVSFVEPEKQRQHFHSDWHRYNLKRKVAELPPVSAVSFQERVLAQKAQTEEEIKSVYCEYCKKVFSNPKSFENHLKSKKHLERIILKATKKNFENHENYEKGNPTEAEDGSDDDEDMEIEEVDSDDWEGEPIPVTTCLFCPLKFKSLERSIKHMTLVHSFFIPDLQYCTNLHGLISYLGEKIGCGMLCLWCNSKGKNFLTLDAIQHHMNDKGHCMIKFEGETLLEYQDFYDYSSSYPDAGDADAEVEPHKLISDGYELTLPSGVTVGHRSLLQYYKQRINPNRTLALSNAASSKSVHQKVMSHYQALGWKGATKADVVKKARDLQFMKRVQTKHWIKVAVKANKLQTHFRPDVVF